MNKIVLTLMVLVTVLTSCMDKQVPVPQKSINAQVDSIMNARKAEIKQQAIEDLDHRAAIEVRVKADSIVQAQETKQSKSAPTKAK